MPGARIDRIKINIHNDIKTFVVNSSVSELSRIERNKQHCYMF